MLALVPLKLLDNAKQRLTEVLSAADRRGLTLAMAADVLSCIQAASSISRCLLISRNVEAAALSAEFGCDRFAEPAAADLPGALHAAIGSLSEVERAAGIIVLPADLPLLTPIDLDHAVRGHQALTAGRGTCTLLPDAAQMGTNALALTPADAMPLIFDGSSYRPHLAAAIERGLLVQSVSIANFALDIDTPADLAALLVRRPDSHAGRFLNNRHPAPAA